MPKNVIGNPWRFDAIGQGEGPAPAEDGIAVTFRERFYISHIITGGLSGAVLITSRPTAGAANRKQADKYTILETISSAVPFTAVYPINATVDGIHIDIIAPGGFVLVYHGLQA